MLFLRICPRRLDHRCNQHHPDHHRCYWVMLLEAAAVAFLFLMKVFSVAAVGRFLVVVVVVVVVFDDCFCGSVTTIFFIFCESVTDDVVVAIVAGVRFKVLAYEVVGITEDDDDVTPPLIS